MVQDWIASYRREIIRYMKGEMKRRATFEELREFLGITPQAFSHVIKGWDEVLVRRNPLNMREKEIVLREDDYE